MCGTVDDRRIEIKTLSLETTTHYITTFTV